MIPMVLPLDNPGVHIQPANVNPLEISIEKLDISRSGASSVLSINFAAFPIIPVTDGTVKYSDKSHP